MADVYRAKDAFYCNDAQGVPRVFTPGTLVFSDDPIFKGKEHLFEPVHVAAARLGRVEDTSAEPGALRSVSTTKRGPGRPKKTEPEPEPPVEE